MRLSKIIDACVERVRHLQQNIRDYKLIRKMHLPSLTKVEEMQIKQTWPCFKFRSLDLGWTRLYKMKIGFSPFFLNDVQYSRLLKRINPSNQIIALQNKAMCDVYFPEIPFPEVYIRRLNGNYFDAQMNILSVDQACSLLLSHDNFIIKPSVDTRCGAGVIKVNCQGKNYMDIKQILESEGLNFIVQEVVSQHPVIHNLNQTSLNCCRIASIYIRGKFDYVASLKVGKKGAEIDNWNSSYFIGIDKNGKLHNVGYDSNINEVTHSDNGIPFAGLQYPNFSSMVALIECMHKKYFPNCGIIGWDLLIDKDGNVKVIETNLDFPGIRALQLCNSLFFESFHKEIIEVMSYEES